MSTALVPTSSRRPVRPAVATPSPATEPRRRRAARAGLGVVLGMLVLPGSAAASGAVPAVPASVAQDRLVAEGLLRPDAATGAWDPETVGAVRRFQRREGLLVDGIAGAATADRLLGDAGDEVLA